MTGEASALMRVLVVDDEPLARSNLLHSLRGRTDVEILGECESAAAALDESALTAT